MIIGWGKDSQKPSETKIAKALRGMPGGENSFVILQKDADNFIQVAGHEESGFLLEYWENKQGHYCTASELSSNTVIRVFKSYVRNDEVWRKFVNWEDMGEESGTKSPSNQKKPRFTREGMMRLALVAILFFISCIIFTPLGLIMGAMVAIVPGLFIYIDFNHQKLNYSLPAPFFTMLVNLVLLPVVIGILSTLPWDDWLSFSLVIPLAAFSVLLFWWGRRLVYHIRLNREGIEEKPSRVWSEKYEVMGDAGPITRSRIVYRFAGDHIGRRNPFWGKPKKKKMFVRYLPDNPSVHQLIRR